MSDTITKSTSLSSSSPGVPTPPYPTPCTVAADDVQSIADLDLAAVGPILEPIQEVLNEAAEENNYPSPPDNTPALSIRSFKHSYCHGRDRGLSAVRDRLATLKFSGPSSSNKSDTQSVAPSIGEEGESEEGAFLMKNGKDLNFDAINSAISGSLICHPGAGIIKVGLGSPATNPRIEEYSAFQLSDFPIIDSVPNPNTIKQNRPVSASESFVSYKSQKSEGGVSEQSNWPELVVDSFERALLQLEQLIRDEIDEDPTVDPKEYYLMHLKKILSDKKRKIPLDIKEKDGLLVIT
jgi:hypothetical protein